MQTFGAVVVNGVFIQELWITSLGFIKNAF